MLSRTFFFSKFIALVAAASMVFAGAPAIGIITASGHFTLERSQVWGNSTLFDGAMVETDSASSEVALRNGVRMQLGAASRARVWENRVTLEKGVGQVAAPPSYEVDAGGLRIRTDSQTARLRVGLRDTVEVTALNGAARVSSGTGVLLASIPAGRSMSFSMQATATRSGCLLYKDGHFILQDENTQEVVEVSGTGLAENVGNRVEVTGVAVPGKPAVTIATAALNVTSTTLKAQGGCLSAGAALGATTEVPAAGATGPAGATGTRPPPKTDGGGMSTGAKVAIVGGVVGAAAGAGIALTGKKGSTSP